MQPIKIDIVQGEFKIDESYFQSELNHEYSIFGEKIRNNLFDLSTHDELVQYVNNNIRNNLSSGLLINSNDNAIDGLEIINYEKKIIYYLCLTQFAGNICLSNTDYNFGVSGGSKNPTDTAIVFSYCANECEKIKNSVMNLKSIASKYYKPYGVNNLLVSLIEHEIKVAIREKYIYETLTDLKTKIDNGVRNVSSAYLDYFNFMYEVAVRKIIPVKPYDKMYYKGEKFWKFIHQELCINDDFVKKLFLQKIALNEMLGQTYVSTKIKPDYLEFFKNIFDGDKLNFRNTLAHYGDVNFDLHSPYTTGLLMEVMIIVSKKFYLI